MNAALPGSGLFKRQQYLQQAEIEAQAAEADIPETAEKTGLDLVVAWSIVGTFIIAASAVIYMMEAILMPVTPAAATAMAWAHG